MIRKSFRTIAVAAALVVSLQSRSASFTDFSAIAADSTVGSNGMDKILSGAEYTLTNKLSGRLITADADGNVCQKAAADGISQKWKIVILADDYCKIVLADDTSAALTVEDVESPNGSNICVSEYTGTDAQQFKINWDGSAYYITTKASENVSAIDVKGKSSAEGANIHQYKYQGNDNQRFDIVPVNNEYSWIKGDLDFDGTLNAFDMCFMKRHLLNGFDDLQAGISDLNGDGKADISDAVLLQGFLLGKDIHFAEAYYKLPYTPPEIDIPDVPVNTDGRKMEYLNRGVNAVSTGKNVFVSWRSLATDTPDMAFNVYRTTDGKTMKLNEKPLTGGTNFTDTTADLKKQNTYFVKSVVNGKEIDTDGNFTLAANSTAQAQILNIKEGGTIHFVWVGDFNGDGAYDYLVDRCTDDHQKLEAYLK